MSTLPLHREPEILRRKRLSDRVAEALEAILVIIPVDAPDSVLAGLPEAARWRQLRSRGASGPRAARGGAGGSGGVRCTALANRRQTRAILGLLPRAAGAFETLALAGRMFKELGTADVETLGLAAPATGGAGEAALEALLSAALAHAFHLPDYRTGGGRARRLRRIELVDGGLDVRRIRAVARGNDLARWLTALPPNKLTAASYRRALGELAREHSLALRWLDEAALKRLGAGAFLAVAAGNAQRTAGIAHLRYRPARARRGPPDLALIGKGILFDTGGTNLKPHRGMLDMHTDMAGSAVALATLCALAQLRAPIAADAWLAITENRTGPAAYVPQEVVTAANGLTIQIIHTDAEGRLVLADTLALAARTRPRLMIDFGTLTGACVTALTERMSGVFANRPELLEPLLAAGRSSGERVWSFPCEADYDADLDSRIADILQCAVDGKGDHILAARFLGRFVPRQIPWVHLDLAAATRSGGLAHINTEVTGFGVRYTLELMLKHKLLDRLGPAP